MQATQKNNDQSIFNAVFNALRGNAVVIDSDGQIAKTNANWNKFAIKQGLDANSDWIGQDYLEVCKKLTGISKESSGEACKGIKAILNGEISNFDLDYASQKPGENQWFKMQASGFELEVFFVFDLHTICRKTLSFWLFLFVSKSDSILFEIVHI